MKMKRFDFAKKCEDWTTDQWSKDIISDESPEQQLVVRSQHVRKPTGKRFYKQYAISTAKRPLSQMIWAWMCNSDIAELYFLTTGTPMNGEAYVELLKERLAIHMHIHRCTISMHDVAPCHR